MTVPPGLIYKRYKLGQELLPFFTVENRGGRYQVRSECTLFAVSFKKQDLGLVVVLCLFEAGVEIGEDVTYIGVKMGLGVPLLRAGVTSGAYHLNIEPFDQGFSVV